jgi:hypothetical protein
MYVTEGQASFGFCPGKATWPGYDSEVFKILIVCAETGSLWETGGISQQPVWLIDLLAWFLPRYNDLRFNNRARAILGDGKDVKPPKPSGR